MGREKIICIFCGAIARVKEQDGQKIVSCPQCMRDTELDILRKNLTKKESYIEKDMV